MFENNDLNDEEKEAIKSYLKLVYDIDYIIFEPFKFANNLMIY